MNDDEVLSVDLLSETEPAQHPTEEHCYHSGNQFVGLGRKNGLMDWDHGE